MSRVIAMPSAVASAQSVSMLGLPAPASSCDSVDFATFARRASSLTESPARSRSWRIAAAIDAASAGPFGMDAISFTLTNTVERS